jgi:ABC-type histidine transport system ATPase subunit
MMGARPNVVMFKFATSKDCHVTLRGRKGMVGTKLGLDENFMPVQQSAQVGDVAAIQGSQSSGQAHILACNQTFRRWH